MWDWIWSRQSPPRRGEDAATPAAKRHTVSPVERTSAPRGKYVGLSAYLEHRHADVVVLTFGQIDDLLGFALPDVARTQQAWWTTTGTDGDRRSPSYAWRCAGRTATPNFLARHVVFERAVEY